MKPRKLYYRHVCKALPPGGKRRKEYLQTLKARMEECLPQDASYEEYCQALGKPEELADAYLADIGCAEINRRYGAGTASLTLRDSYYNMKEKIDPHPELIEHARAAFAKNGVEMCCVPIRGGTDGARLSWDGLPCPNLPTGGYNYHGVHEFIPVDSLAVMPDVLLEIIGSFVENV